MTKPPVLPTLTADDFLAMTVRDVERRKIAQPFCSVAIGERFQYAHNAEVTYTKTAAAWAKCTTGKKWRFGRNVWVVAC